MWILALKLGPPTILLVKAIITKWSRLHDKKTRRRAVGVLLSESALYISTRAVLAVEHVNRAAESAREQRTREIAERVAVRAEAEAIEDRREADTARRERQVIITEVNRLSTAVIGGSADLPVTEALDRIGDAYGRLEDELNGCGGTARCRNWGRWACQR